jgi:hypothetical protein
MKTKLLLSTLAFSLFNLALHALCVVDHKLDYSDVSSVDPKIIFRPSGSVPVLHNANTCRLASSNGTVDEICNITCPDDVTVASSLDLCGYIVDGTEFDASIMGDCDDFVVTNNYNGASSFGSVLLPVDVHTIVWTATDGTNTATCSITIEVEDDQDPVFIACPPSVTLSLANGGCNTVLTWSISVAEDNCGITSIAETGGPPFGSQQGVGIYNIIYTATCVFAITLEDTRAQIAQYQLHVSLIDDESSAMDFLSRLNCSADATCVYTFSSEFFPVEDLVIFKNMDGSVEIGLPTGVRTVVSLNEANMPNPTVAILAGSDGTSISMRTFTTDTCCYSEVYNPVVITNCGRCTTTLTGSHQVLSDVFFHFSWASC